MLQHPDQEFLERTTGFEPATLTLANTLLPGSPNSPTCAFANRRSVLGVFG